MNPMLNMAIKAAHEAGDIIARSADRIDQLQIENKDKNDFVSEIDRAAEDTIIGILKKAYPDHSFIGEESGKTEGTSSVYEWIIDPLDGTTNFLYGIPHYAVSIALKKNGKLDQRPRRERPMDGAGNMCRPDRRSARVAGAARGGLPPRTRRTVPESHRNVGTVRPRPRIHRAAAAGRTRPVRPGRYRAGAARRRIRVDVVCRSRGAMARRDRRRPSPMGARRQRRCR